MPSLMYDRFRGTSEYDRVREFLVKIARTQQLVRYRPAVPRLIGIAVEDAGDHVVASLASVCGEISEDEYDAGRPMLSAAGVNQDNPPGDGFFVWHLGWGMT